MLLQRFVLSTSSHCDPKENSAYPGWRGSPMPSLKALGTHSVARATMREHLGQTPGQNLGNDRVRREGQMV
jgi:hypothetical protein